MANNLGYESFYAGSGSVPSQATRELIAAGAKAAIFYVGIEQGGGGALYRGDGPAPTLSAGLPVQPGGHIILVGEGNITNARWENSEPGKSARIHVLYYDQMDIVAANLIGRDVNQKGDGDGGLSREILTELRLLTAMAEIHWGLNTKSFKVS